jgi:hypothetical protein
MASDASVGDAAPWCRTETEAGRTCLECDLPSSLFGRLGDDRITQVARTLDRKLEALVTAVTG